MKFIALCVLIFSVQALLDQRGELKKLFVLIGKQVDGARALIDEWCAPPLPGVAALGIAETGLCSTLQMRFDAVKPMYAFQFWNRKWGV